MHAPYQALSRHLRTRKRSGNVDDVFYARRHIRIALLDKRADLIKHFAEPERANRLPTHD